MNDNGLPNDPLFSAQFQVPGIFRQIIDQAKARPSGEFFPTLSGDFLRVESVDFPARISFNNNDENQAVPLISGFIFQGKFSGITIWHDDYTATTAKPQIIFDVGRGNSANIDNQNGTTLVSLPFRIFTFTTAAFTIDFPSPYGYKRIDVNASVIYNNGTNPGFAQVTCQFADINNNLIRAGLLTRNGNNYNWGGDPLSRAIPAVAIAATVWEYDMSFTLNIPTRAEYARLLGTFAGSTSAGSVTASAFAK